MKLSITVTVNGSDLQRDYVVNELPSRDWCADKLLDLIESSVEYNKEHDDVF
jgi:hypothetical protein